MSTDSHYFVAVSLPKETKFLLKDKCDQLKKILSFNRWVHHLDYHITLAFLGSVPIEKLNLTIELISQKIKDERAFSLNIHHFGVFGKKDSPRVFWSDVQHQEKLSLLRNKVFSACLEAGFSLETRPFTPHITLARKWDGNLPFSLELLKENNILIPFEVTDVVLYKTHLDKSPKYEGLTTFPLLNE